MRRQKPAPAHRAQWWQPVRPPAVLAMTTCLMVCWAVTAVDGAPNAGFKVTKDSSNWCSPLRDVIFRNLMEREEFRPSPFPRPALCNDDSIRNLMNGSTCGYNSSASGLWKRVCPEKIARGGSGLNPLPSGATGTQPSISNNPSNLTRIARQARVRDQVTPSPNDDKLKKVTGLIKKVACKPRFVLVDVEKAPGEEHFIFEPCQVKVKRCTGCCNNDAMVCTPTRNSTKKVTVLQMMNYGSLQNSNEGSPTDGRNFVKKNAVHHMRCECQCKVQATHCSPSQQHDPGNCRCRCPAESERSCNGSTKYFNTTSCACECRSKKICSTGMTFNNDTCRCG